MINSPMPVDTREIINLLYKGHDRAREILVAHSEAVARKALEIARGLPLLKPDLSFIEEAAMLHDIGMIMTKAPMLGCTGSLPYICHGVQGKKMLDAEGLPLHALVCERHIGVGLSVEDIRANRFPIPEREMLPLSVEEKIVCFADKFFSKLGDTSEKPLEKVRVTIKQYGPDKLNTFEEMARMLGVAE